MFNSDAILTPALDGFIVLCIRLFEAVCYSFEEGNMLPWLNMQNF